MSFSMPTLARALFGFRPDAVCAAKIWDAGVAELRARSDSRRESGAFLLGSKGKRRHISEFVFYDDIDPDCLRNGIVEIDGRNLGALWHHCRERGLAVVADVHVHPGGYGQSGSDKANPIMAEVGHVAVILPDFAATRTRPGGIGVFRYLGARKWADLSQSRLAGLHVGWWPRWL